MAKVWYFNNSIQYNIFVQWFHSIHIQMITLALYVLQNDDKFKSPCVLQSRLIRVVNWEDKTKEDLALKFRKRRENNANCSPEKTEDKLSLENHQVLSQTIIGRFGVNLPLL